MRAAGGWRERVPLNEVPLSQAIVVLSNASVLAPGGSDRVEWRDDVDRFDAGIALYKAGMAPMLILTGARLPWSKDTRSA